MQQSDNILGKTNPLNFLSGHGEMQKLILSFDWKTTPLGSPGTWSQSLRTTISIMLSNRFPMLLWWGPDYISIYNDAYIPILGTKHPWGLGKPVRECWSEIWHILQPLIDTPFKGGAATWMEDLTLEIKRHGFLEETHFTIAYSPVPDETAPNRIGGVLATVTEISDKVVGERRINILRDLGTHAIDAKTREVACTLSAKTIENYPYDIPFAMFYLVDENGSKAHLAGSSGINTGEAISPLIIDLENETGQPLPYSKVFRTGKMETVEDLPGKFNYLPIQPWSEPAHTAVVIPVPSIKPHHYSGIIVAGASPRLRFNESYKSFFELLTTQIATAIANASAFEEERKRAAALEEIDKAKTIFFSNISHEFRTPLTLMLSPLEELLNRQENNFTDQEKQNLETTHRNALRLLKLVNSLLDFSRIESGRQQASFTLVDIAALTKNLAGNFRSIIEKAGLELIVKCDSTVQSLYVDRQMWEKIVFNLLSNAFKYTLKGSITVELCSEKDFAVLKIKDTGVGIPENEIATIFERFHRVHNVMGRTYEGTGIGLSLIKQLVQLHAGTVDVESRLSEGSTFTVKIPFGKEHLTPAQITDDSETDETDDITSAIYIKAAESLIEKYVSEKSGITLNKDKKLPLVMVVDDNTDMREHLRSVLAKRFNVVTANNGIDALQKLNIEMPDLILSDIMMPVMDGTGLLKEIRSSKATANIPVIFLTARAGEESKIEGWEIGANDYLVKPFSSRELVSRVASQIYTKKIRDDAQQELQNIFRQAPVSIVVYRGKDYKVEVANDMALQMWGKSWDEVANKLFNEISRAINPDLPAIHEQVYKTGIPFYGKEFPASLEHDGKAGTRYFDFVYTPLKDQQGKTTGVVAVGTEVTGSVLARKKIEESENRYRELSLSLEEKVKKRTEELVAQKEFSEIIVNTSPDLIAVYDTEMRILEFNKACEDLLGLKKEDVIGKRYIDIFPVAQNSQGHKDLLRAFEGEIIYNKHFQSAVTGRHFQNSIVPLKDGHGKVYAAVAIAHDITDVIEATEMIKQNEEKFNKLFSASPLGLTLSDVPTGRLVDVNEVHLQTVGYTREEYLNRTSLELNLIDKDDREKILNELLKNGVVRNAEVNIRKKSGEIIPVLNSIEAIFINNKKYFLSAIIDISDRKKAEESVKKANRELNEKNIQLEKMNDELASFSYVASHDLQEPLRKIQTFGGRILEEQTNFSERTKDYFNRIIGAAHRMQNLIDALLNYSRTNTAEKKFASCDLNNLLEDVKNDLQGAIEEKKAVIISGDLPTLKVINHQFQQLISNIISNSLKYSRPGIAPEIKISANKVSPAELEHLPDENYKEYWKISISDNGIGFEQQYENKIFELFQRLHSRSEYSGTGIGLAICKKIVQNHNGYITAKGEPDKGARFDIYLPNL